MIMLFIPSLCGCKINDSHRNDPHSEEFDARFSDEIGIKANYFWRMANNEMSYKDIIILDYETMEAIKKAYIDNGIYFPNFYQDSCEYGGIVCLYANDGKYLLVSIPTDFFYFYAAEAWYYWYNYEDIGFSFYFPMNFILYDKNSNELHLLVDGGDRSVFSPTAEYNHCIDNNYMSYQEIKEVYKNYKRIFCKYDIAIDHIEGILKDVDNPKTDYVELDENLKERISPRYLENKNTSFYQDTKNTDDIICYCIFEKIEYEEQKRYALLSMKSDDSRANKEFVIGNKEFKFDTPHIFILYYINERHYSQDYCMILDDYESAWFEKEYKDIFCNEVYGVYEGIFA